MWLIWIVLLFCCYCCVVRLIWVLLHFDLLNIQVCAVDLFAVLLLCIDCLFTFVGFDCSVGYIGGAALLCFCNLCFGCVLYWLDWLGGLVVVFVCGL